MNTVVISILLLCSVNFCYGTSQPVILNTRAEECIDGVCKSICSWDGVKIAEGESLNQPGKCRLLHCSDDGQFKILITACPFDSKCRNDAHSPKI